MFRLLQDLYCAAAVPDVQGGEPRSAALRVRTELRRRPTGRRLQGSIVPRPRVHFVSPEWHLHGVCRSAERAVSANRGERVLLSARVLLAAR